MNKNKSNRDFAANRVRKTRLKFEPDSEVTPNNSNEGEEDFTENIFREAVNHMDARRQHKDCLLYTSPSPRDATLSRMPSSA